MYNIHSWTLDKIGHILFCKCERKQQTHQKNKEMNWLPLYLLQQLTKIQN